MGGAKEQSVRKATEATKVIKGEREEPDIGRIQGGDDGWVSGSGGVPSNELGPAAL